MYSRMLTLRNYKVKLATVVEGNQKAPLSKEVSSTIFKVFGMTRPGIEPRS